MGHAATIQHLGMPFDYCALYVSVCFVCAAILMTKYPVAQAHPLFPYLPIFSGSQEMYGTKSGHEAPAGFALKLADFPISGGAFRILNHTAIHAHQLGSWCWARGPTVYDGSVLKS